MVTKQEAYFYAAMAAVVVVLFWAKPAEGAEIECEAKYVEAWDFYLERYIIATRYDCGSYAYTEPEGLGYAVVDGNLTWYIREEER